MNRIQRNKIREFAHELYDGHDLDILLVAVRYKLVFLDEVMNIIQDKLDKELSENDML